MSVKRKCFVRSMQIVGMVCLLSFTACGDDNEVSTEPLDDTFLNGDVASVDNEPSQDANDDLQPTNSLGASDNAESNGDQNSDRQPEQATTEPGASEIQPPANVIFMPLTDAGDVVEFVEIERYMGRWYEIATTPSFQQRSCFNTQAEYTFNETEGNVDVVNRCAAGGPNGRPQRIQGKAELVDTETQAKLTVSFFGQRAPYWVVALDGANTGEPYRWAVVSVPGKRTMWILSRTSIITDGLRSEIEAHLETRGFPIESLIDTPQAD
jgi:apolipoprotein D and lipocalin family protein